MRRVLGLDIGERRIGFAFANEMGIGTSMVLPGGFLAVRNDAEAISQVKNLVEEEEPDAIVIGVPLVNDEETGQSKKIRRLAAQIQEALPDKKFYFWDERLTSFDAGQQLVQAELKHSGKAKKGRVDAVAASLILQGFLDSRRLLGGA